MDVETIRWLYDYNRWVNRRLLATAEKVPEERTRERFGASFDTILGTLGHILGGEVIWLERWRGGAAGGVPHVEAPGGLPDLRRRWLRHEEEQNAFLADLTPERLAAPVRYQRSGKSYQLPLWQAMVHVVNHGTHHRSELAEMLTRTEHAPEDTGFSSYCLERSGQ